MLQWTLGYTCLFLFWFPWCVCPAVGLLGFPGGSEVKASASNVGDPGWIPGSGRSPGEGNGNPLQYSCLENPMDRGAWQATVHGVAKSQTWLRDFTQFNSLKMAVLFPVFKGISTLFSIVAVLVCITTNSVRGFPFFHILSSIYCLQTFGSQPFWLVWSGTTLWSWFTFL